MAKNISNQIRISRKVSLLVVAFMLFVVACAVVAMILIFPKKRASQASLQTDILREPSREDKTKATDREKEADYLAILNIRFDLHAVLVLKQSWLRSYPRSPYPMNPCI